MAERGPHLIVVLNGQQTVDVNNGNIKAGPLAPQSAGGTIRFRKVENRAI